MLTLGAIFALTAVVVGWILGGPEIRPSLVSGLFTVFAAIGAAYVAFWQLRRQAENINDANRRNEVMKLKKEIYADT